MPSSPEPLTDASLRAFLDERQLAGYEANFASAELLRGVEYHLGRIDMLGMSGDLALDAGCGVGNWTLALSRRFARTEALEYSPGRLAVVRALAERFALPVHPVLGSVESLPYADATFDAVYCNGVIFLVDVETTLSEFARVLKPGGLLYLGYNPKRWWNFLIDVRGPAEPNCRMFGRDAWLDRAWRLARGLPADALLSPMLRDLVRRASSPPTRTTARGPFARLFAGATDTVPVDSVRAALVAGFAGPHAEASAPDRRALGLGAIRRQLEWSAALDSTRARELLDALVHLDRFVDEESVATFLDGLVDTALGHRSGPLDRPERASRILQPDEVAEMLGAVGLRVVADGPEGMVHLTDAPRMPPICTDEQGVWETVARR